MRVILDTNILVSALLHVERVPSTVLNHWVKGAFELLTVETQVDELRRVVNYPMLRHRIKRFQTGELINKIRRDAIFIDELPDVQRSHDPNDDYLLSLAEAGRADWLVTGDKPDLLALRKHGSTPIISVHDFAEMLGV